MAVKTYSFSECTLTLSHTSLGRVSTDGAGMGKISLKYSADRTSIDVAADGVPIVTKIKNRTGSLSIDVQQISTLHTTLKKWLNYLTNASTKEWAGIYGTLTSKTTNEQFILTGVAITKHPDMSYETSAGSVTWDFQVAEVTSNVI